MVAPREDAGRCGVRRMAEEGSGSAIKEVFHHCGGDALRCLFIRRLARDGREAREGPPERRRVRQEPDVVAALPRAAHGAFRGHVRAQEEVGRAAGISVSVCGEMASEALSAVLLIGLGYERLSVSPPALPLVKWVVRTVPDDAARQAASAALDAASAEEVSAALRETVGKFIDVRLLDPSSALPGRGRVGSLRP